VEIRTYKVNRPVYCMKLTRSGCIVPDTPEVKKELTVRPIVNADFGVAPPSFKVFRKAKSGLCVPRYYAEERFGSVTEDVRPEPTKIKISFHGKLRDETHQNEALAKAIETGHGILSLPCGFGKTTVSLAIACKLGYRTMIVVHKEFLANQWRERIQQFCPGASIGIVQQNKKELDCDFVIAMLQSLSLKEYSFEDFDSIGTLIVDEAHHICAKVFSQSLFKLCPKHTFGLSATPNRKDGLTKVLHWFMGPTFFSVERKQQDQVDVFPLEFTCDRYEDPPPCTRYGKLSLPTMITEITEIPDRNRLILQTIKDLSKTTRQVLVLSDRRFHCEYLHEKFKTTSGLYMGGMKEAELAESSKKKIIFATFSQAHEGLDIPSLDTVILATPKSDIVQSIGRIMRETKGKKNNPRIYDVVDQWSVFFAMYNKRLRVYRQGGFNIPKQPREDKYDFTPGKCLIQI
jgi:superfamily II DNA or RNA helicase